ncbi:MAG: YkgJ family cysteine cluster protein [Polyangiaceae bacterium]
MTAELTEREAQRLEQAFDAERALNRQVLREVRTPAELGALAMFVAARTDPRVDALGVQLKVACARGCSWCCRGLRVEVTPPEAIALAEYIRLRTAPEQLPRLLEGLREAAAEARSKSSLQLWDERRPCYFLDTESGACTVYEARPLGCRSVMSLDASACEAAHRGQGVALPRPMAVDALYGVARMALHAACEDAGLDMRGFELTNALEAAFHTPHAAERWHAGERVFDAAVTPELAGNAAPRDLAFERSQLVPAAQLLRRTRPKTANEKKRERRSRRG